MSGTRCTACGLAAIATSVDGIFEHANRRDCSTVLFDVDGKSLDDLYEIIDGVIYEREPVTTVVNCKTDEYDVYIGRGSTFGNPFATAASDSKYPVVIVGSTMVAINNYAKWLLGDEVIPGWTKPKIAHIQKALKGKRLGCYCAPDACHGDVLAKIADGFTDIDSLVVTEIPTALVIDDPVADDPSAAFPLPPMATLPKPKRGGRTDFFVSLNGEETNPHYSYDLAINEIFETAKVPKLGGASGGLGWSSFSLFQQCPYKWRRMTLDGARGRESQALVIGSCVHALLAIHYSNKMDANYPLKPRAVYEALLAKGCNPEWIDEAWRLFDLHTLFYAGEPLVPLAVEHLVVDPKTGESCRYDLICRIERAYGGFAPGTYWVDFKTTARIDDTALTGWRGDGEIIGQGMIWHRNKLSRKFGEVRGCIIDLIPKTKEPAFTRVAVNVMPWQIKAHARDLQQWQALRNLFIATNTFPRSRSNCITRHGKCPLWDQCADGDRDV